MTADWAWRTEALSTTLALPGWRAESATRLADGSGGILLVANPPAQRAWTPAGILTSSRDVPWRLEPTAAGSTLVADEAATVDLLELHGTAATAARSDQERRMTVLGSFAPVQGPESVGRFLVGDRVLDTNDFGGRRCPSEQTALSLYRIARHRGGAFWTGVAGHVVAAVRRRLDDTPDGLLVHGVYGGDETHTRFLADAALLMAAAGETAATARALAGLDALSVAWGGGRWTLHDSGERDRGDNDLVLNTHVQSMVARLALGADIRAEAVALDTALRDRRLVRRTGYLRRDLGAVPMPAYLTVNLYDLAALCANAPTARARWVLRRGLAYAVASRTFRDQLRTGHAQSVVQPLAWGMAGYPAAARRAAAQAEAVGWAPTVGWPGYGDRLWPRLAAGTP